MKTVFTLEDIKNIADNIFNGNLWLSKLSNGEIAYENENSENILLINESDGTQTEKDLAEYLNIKFYTWKQRLVEKSNYGYDEQPLSLFDEWVQSLNFSMNEAYALVERIDEEVTVSQDIDNATYLGKITLLIQTNKVKNLEYYITKLRNKFLGLPQTIQNSYGALIKAFILIGSLSYEDEPLQTPLGECIITSFNFKISYLENALTYSDTEIAISLDGDDTYDENGQIVGETKYLTLPLTKASFQNIFTSAAMPTSKRPDLTGFVATALSTAKTFSFFDYVNKELSSRFNQIFWECSAYRVDGIKKGVSDINIPIYIKVTSNGHSYVYKDVIDNMQKSITNNDFNISSITTKGWGKIVNN